MRESATLAAIFGRRGGLGGFLVVLGGVMVVPDLNVVLVSDLVVTVYPVFVVRMAAVAGVVVLAEVDVKVEKPAPNLSVVVPVEGRMRAETCSHQRDQRHQQRTESSDAVPESPTQASQHHPRIVPFPSAPRSLRHRRLGLESMMFEQIEENNARPIPFSVTTADALWTDELATIARKPRQSSRSRLRPPARNITKPAAY